MLRWVFAAVMAISTPARQIDQPIAPPAQVMALPAGLRARLQDDVLADSPSQRKRLNRLLHLVFDKDGLGLVYEDDATESVSQIYATRTANCLSFTLMFIALAREAGLDAYPQEIPETLAWHQDNGVFYRVDHINTIVHIGGIDYLVDIARDSVIALRTPERVTDQRLLAHYYNNLAMRDLEQGRIAPAMETMATALQLDPRNSTNWSNAGVLYLRNGDAAAAEQAYTKALVFNPANTSALANMANLAHINGDHDRETELRKRLERQQQFDPFFHFIQAEGYVQSGDYAQAIEHYQRAIRLHGEEPRFYAALAHAYVLSGDTRQAIKALTRAEWFSNDTARADIETQLVVLRKRGQQEPAAKKGSKKGSE